MQEGETQLHDSHQYTCDWRPQTNQQQHCGAGNQQFQDEWRCGRRRQKSCDGVLNEWNGCYCSQQ